MEGCAAVIRSCVGGLAGGDTVHVVAGLGGGTLFEDDMAIFDMASVRSWLDGGGHVDNTGEWQLDNDTYVGGVTMLMSACADGNVPLVDLLLEHGANVNRQAA